MSGEQITLDLVHVYRDHPKWDEVEHWTGMGIPLLQELKVAVITVTTVLEEGETRTDLEFHYTPEAVAYAQAEHPGHVYVSLMPVIERQRARFSPQPQSESTSPSHESRR
jgi:hypothetical protein